jgi:hypothetical protein
MTFFRPLAALTIAAIGVFSSPARAADVKSVYDRDDFVISYWCGPPAKFTTLERYQEVKDAHFTVAMNPCGGMTVADNRKMLDYCQTVGMKAIVMDSRMIFSIGNSAENKAKLDAIVKDYADHPALFGYYIVDEPGAGAYPGLAEVVAYLKEKDPAHIGFINLLPTYAGPMGALGTKTYEEYVHQFVDIVKPAMISYDHYHFTNGGDGPEFFKNLEIVRKVALETKTPFWNIVLNVQHGGYRNLTEPELRFEAMQTLAYGARGLLWFTYWSPADTDKSTEWQHAMINPDGSHDPHYEMIKKINADVLAIAKELRGATSTGVFAGKPPADAPVQVDTDKLTVGVFQRSGGKQFALLASRDYKSETHTSVTRAGGEKFDIAGGAWSPLDPNQTIPAGGAILLRW